MARLGFDRVTGVGIEGLLALSNWLEQAGQPIGKSGPQPSINGFLVSGPTSISSPRPASIIEIR